VDIRDLDLSPAGEIGLLAAGDDSPAGVANRSPTGTIRLLPKLEVLKIKKQQQIPC
jgi:hypothetical protein